jgi:hypothetical protein
MKQIKSDEIGKGQIVMVLNTTTNARGMIGTLFRVLAVDEPYCVLLWLSSCFQSRHVVRLDDFTFALPAAELIAEALPDEAIKRDEELDIT